jgi:DNA-directed RNA polymerase subunit N (RpoN/RPB10)
MIIPIRCFTCGKVLADKYEYYKKRISDKEKAQKEAKTQEPQENKEIKTGDILDELGLTRMCCRRHMLGQVDLIEII